MSKVMFNKIKEFLKKRALKKILCYNCKSLTRKAHYCPCTHCYPNKVLDCKYYKPKEVVK